MLCSCSTCTEWLLFNNKMRKGTEKTTIILYEKDRQNVHRSTIPLALTGSLPSIFCRYDDALFQRHIRSYSEFYLWNVLNVKANQATEHIANRPTHIFLFQCAHTLQTLTLIKRFSSFCLQNLSKNTRDRLRRFWHNVANFMLKQTSNWSFLFRKLSIATHFSMN